MKWNHQSLKHIAHAVFAGTAASLFASCATTRETDYAAYTKIPVRTSSVVTIAVVKSNPYMAKRGTYGNYGGPGNNGGYPVDEMDELFRRHDMLYREARTLRMMRVADAMLVEKLEGLDPSKMSPEGRRYRERALKFMKSGLAKIVCKPLLAFVHQNEREGSLFPDEKSIRQLFERRPLDFPQNQTPAPQGLPVDTGAAVAVAVAAATPAGENDSKPIADRTKARSQEKAEKGPDLIETGSGTLALLSSSP